MGKIKLRTFNKDRAAHKPDNYTTTTEGYWIVEGTYASEGPMEYPQPDGTTIYQHVSLDVLRDSQEGLKDRPITLEHPAAMVGPASYQKEAHGHVLDVWIDEEKKEAKAKFLITTSDALSALESGKRGLSPGYLALLADLEGGIEGIDLCQKKRIYNHLALVDSARGGERAKVNLDSKGYFMADTKEYFAFQVDSMEEESDIEETEEEVEEEDAEQEEESADEEGKEKPSYDELKKAYDELKKGFDKLSGQLDQMKEQGDSMKTRSAIAKEVAEITRAKALADRLGVKYQADSTASDIKLAVVKSQVKGKLARTDEGYIDGRFELIEEANPARNSYNAFRFTKDAADDDKLKDLDKLQGGFFNFGGK